MKVGVLAKMCKINFFFLLFFQRCFCCLVDVEITTVKKLRPISEQFYLLAKLLALPANVMINTILSITITDINLRYFRDRSFAPSV